MCVCGGLSENELAALHGPQSERERASTVRASKRANGHGRAHLCMRVITICYPYTPNEYCLCLYCMRRMASKMPRSAQERNSGLGSGGIGGDACARTTTVIGVCAPRVRARRTTSG